MEKHWISQYAAYVGFLQGGKATVMLLLNGKLQSSYSCITVGSLQIQVGCSSRTPCFRSSPHTEGQ